jgi:hypothetical protein
VTDEFDPKKIAAWKCEICHHWVGTRYNAPPTILKVGFREFVATVIDLEPVIQKATLLVCRGCLYDIEHYDSVSKNAFHA